MKQLSGSSRNVLHNKSITFHKSSNFKSDFRKCFEMRKPSNTPNTQSSALIFVKDILVLCQFLIPVIAIIKENNIKTNHLAV